MTATRAGFAGSLRAETLAARRSVVPLCTLIAVTLAGAVAGLFMFVAADPARARSLGLLNQKAQLAGMTADWPGLLAFLAQLAAVGDLLLFAFVTTWVFGREAAHGTLRYLLALPVPRTTIALAKLVVIAVWALVANLWLTVIVLGCGWLLDLPGADPAVIGRGLATAGLAAGLMWLVSTPVAFVACAARGYLAPLASALAALVLAQVATALGWAGVTPWAIPAVAAGLAPSVTLNALGLAIAALTGAAGILGTLAWWRSGLAGA